MFGYLNNVLVGTINANIFSSAFVTINGLSLGVVDRLIFDANLGGGFQLDNVNLNFASAVAEPGTLALLGLGLLGLGVTRRRKAA